MSLLAAAMLVLLLMVLSSGYRGSAQSPRMNPCPSARPGEGEQEENRRGSLSAQSGSERSERRLGETDFVLAGGARAEPSHPRSTKKSRSVRFLEREGSKPGGPRRRLGTREPVPQDAPNCVRMVLSKSPCTSSSNMDSGSDRRADRFGFPKANSRKSLRQMRRGRKAGTARASDSSWR
jgi:hypothetical protein